MNRRDDPIEARKQVEQEQDTLRKLISSEKGHLLSFDDKSTWPTGDGDHYLIPFQIGFRGVLTKHEARRAARLWREVLERYPNGAFVISITGYENDPRELYEFPEVTRYVRWWARFSGMDDLIAAERYLGLSSPAGRLLAQLGNLGLNSFAFLAGCGVFGDEFRTAALRNLKPTTKQ